MRFYSLEKLINLYDGYRKAFKIDQYRFMLVQVDGERYLFDSHCPHQGHPLIDSDIIGNDLRCPLHGYHFDIVTGKPTRTTSEPCRALQIYELVYQQRDIGVLL